MNPCERLTEQMAGGVDSPTSMLTRPPVTGVQERKDGHTDASWAQDLVVQCARTRLSDRRVAAIHQHIRGGVDWQRVARGAIAHGVHPLVYHTLRQHGAGLLPDEVQREIERFERIATIRNTFMTDELGRLLDRFEHEGIPALPLKGPVLAQGAYGDMHRRWYTDLDILIPPRAFNRVEALLLEGGYVPFEKVRHLRGLKRKLYYYLSGQWPFKRGKGVFNLDVHAHVMPPGYYYPVTFEKFWRRSRALALGGTIVRRFAAEDMLQVLCFHGAKNQWGALKHVCDVAELIEAEPSMDWKTVVARAQAVRGVRILSLGLLLTRRVLNAPVPSEVLNQLTPSASLKALAARLKERLTSSVSRTPFTYEERVQMQLLLQDTWPKKVRYALYSFARNVWDKWIK